VDRAPRELWSVPGIAVTRADELARMQEAFPPDVRAPVYRYGRSRYARGTPNVVGRYTDDWGAVWQVAEDGIVGEVKEPPLADWGALAGYRLPRELLDEADLSQVNASCAATDAFVRVGTETRPFERLQFLRGSEALFLDLAYGTAEVRRLLAMLHEFHCRELSLWAATDVDGVSISDDWGAQTRLLIDPSVWRDLFKPLYRDYCQILRGGGKYVFFPSDGFIEAIYPDLIEIGVHALNSQLFCMDVEALGEQYRGRITFWGEIDRQRILPFGTEAEVRQAVRRVRRALDRGRGGVIAQCEWGTGVPFANVAAVFDEWNRPAPTGAGEGRA
jgi:hypothetical protein